MINLFLNGGELDIKNGQSVDWNYTPIRFTESLTEPYSTDFELPNTMHNTQLLQACGLLDSENRFSSRLEPCIMVINGNVLNSYLQVASINADTISVAIFEKSIPNDVLDKSILDFVKDDQNTIWDWDRNSQTNYPTVFKKYMHAASNGQDNYCMYHPSRKMNDILDIISLSSGYELPHTDSRFWVTATNKNVCPQNKRQVLEVTFGDDAYGKINGSQHITNDMEWSWEPSEDVINFNRQCNCQIDFYVFAWARDAWGTDSYFETIIDRPTLTPTQDHFTLIETSDNHKRNYIYTDSWTVPQNYIINGSTMKFRMQDLSHFRMVNAVVVLTFDDYEIIEDEDYDIELQYIARAPRIKIRDYAGVMDRYIVFDGTQQVVISFKSETQTITPPYLSFARIGLYCNMADTPLKDILWGLAWMTETKFQKRNWSYYFDSAYDSYQIDGEITNIETTNSALGKKNHKLFESEKESDVNIVSEIDNFWLDANVTIHQSPFACSSRKFGNWAGYLQYSDFEYDEEKDSYECKYEDIDGMALSKIESTTPNLLLRLEIPDFTFDEVLESTTVEIETFDSVYRADFVYLHGRKYMVQSIETDVNTGKSTIQGIEIWKKCPNGIPPTVEITNVSDITGSGATITFTITENQ